MYLRQTRFCNYLTQCSDIFIEYFSLTERFITKKYYFEKSFIPNFRWMMCRQSTQPVISRILFSCFKIQFKKKYLGDIILAATFLSRFYKLNCRFQTFDLIGSRVVCFFQCALCIAIQFIVFIINKRYF